MIKIALALIVKGSDAEAKFLSNCLNSNAKYFDGIFITSTYKKGEEPNNKVSEVAGRFNANVSYFQWVDDFSAARNYNFSMVPKEYNYIVWCDADDVFFNLSVKGPAGYENRLKKILEEKPEFDAWTMQYYYDKDESNNPTIVHTKTQVIKNNCSVEWVGRIHEDFKENRQIKVGYIDEIKRIHVTSNEHSREAAERNLVISLKEFKDKPDDPRSYFNLGNAYMGCGKYKQAKAVYQKFLESSQSEAEKYTVYQRLALAEKELGNKERAVECLQMSIGLAPEFPDSYHHLGYMLFDFGRYDEAEKYLLLGLITKPQYQRMVVYNPRDYDYNPMRALAKVYFRKSRPDLALPLLKGCFQIYPDDANLKVLVEDMEKETKRLEKVIEAAKKIDALGDDKEKILFEINKLPHELQSHPAISRIRNKYVVKTTSTGKDICYYCGETKFDWNPELFKTKGFGGSEEAVINLAKEWSKQGYNVTVYNSCGLEPIHADGVVYKPWWMFNLKDKWDTIVLWRSPLLLEYELNAKTVLVDLHDVVNEGEFTKKRLDRATKIMVKTKAHRVLFPNIPDEKFAIVPNGIDLEPFKQEIKKDPYLLINTSSPDRSMDTLPKLFKEVKKQVPQARLKWIYGWDNYEKWYQQDKRMMAWKQKTQEEMLEAGIEDCGRVPQSEAAKLYLEGRVFAYPSDFYEIDCISVKKAQLAGCIPVTTDFAAMKESNAFGKKAHKEITIKDWAKPYRIGFGTKDENAQKQWVEEVVKILKSPLTKEKEMIKWAEGFDWSNISKQWINAFL